ncbi:MAG TPA: hypothetical protein VM287_09425 [Egibacteraceae bacterium]|jgi:hypothetical protein|nr:hypothetical protein [Egibacteraceae bacterium]
MGTSYGDLEDHEGYAMRRLPDGTMTGSWTPQTAEFTSYVAACSCLWRGASHPPTEAGHEEALDEWDRHHARPLLAQAVPPRVRELLYDVKRVVAALGEERPAAGRTAARELAAWASAAAARLGQSAEPPPPATIAEPARKPGTTISRS